MKKYNKFFERISQCLQIDTSNSYMLENNLDYSGGNSTPQYKFNPDDDVSFEKPLEVFADSDLMYSDKLTSDVEINEVNSKENAEANLPLLEF